MLPDFRFLFVATVLSMSILVFGLGAAALLRAAHEEFASTPAWHPPQETVFTQQAESTGPVLAMLRIDAPVAERKTSDDTAVTTSTVQPAIISTPVETERTAALEAQDPLPSDIAKPEASAAERPAQDDTTSPPAVSSAAAVETTTATSEEKVSPPASEAAPAAAEQTNASTSTKAPTPTNTPTSAEAPTSPDTSGATTKTAALDSPAAIIEAKPPAKPAVTRHGKNAIKKAKRANRNRKLALRARLVQQAPQQLTDPFGQPMPMVATRRR